MKFGVSVLSSITFKWLHLKALAVTNNAVKNQSTAVLFILKSKKQFQTEIFETKTNKKNQTFKRVVKICHLNFELSRKNYHDFLLIKLERLEAVCMTMF